MEMDKIVIKVSDGYLVGKDGSITDRYFIVRKDLVEECVRLTKKDREPARWANTLDSLEGKGRHTIRTDEVREYWGEEYRVYRITDKELLVRTKYDDALAPLAWSVKMIDGSTRKHLLYYDKEGKVMAAAGCEVAAVYEERLKKNETSSASHPARTGGNRCR